MVRIMPQNKCGIIPAEEHITAQRIIPRDGEANRVLDTTKRRDNSTVAALWF